MLSFIADVLWRAGLLTLALYMAGVAGVLFWSVVHDARRALDGRPTLGEELRERLDR